MVGAAVDLVAAGVPGRVGVVDDGLIGHEEADDVGQLPGVAEVDGVRSTFDHHQEHVGVGLATYATRAGVGINGSRSPSTASVGTLRSSSRSSEGYWVSARNILNVLGMPKRT